MQISRALPQPLSAPVDPAIQGQVVQLADLARSAFQLSPVYWSEARDVGLRAAALGAALLPQLTGTLLDFASAGVEWLQRANATWGTTAKNPYWMAQGQLGAAVEVLAGYHEGDRATHPRPFGPRP
jgi:hypothetical protein